MKFFKGRKFKISAMIGEKIEDQILMIPE